MAFINKIFYGVPGRSRGKEKRQARAAEFLSSGAYGGWAQNDLAKMMEAIERSISRKVNISQRHTFSDLNAIWLLISSSVSTFVAWLDEVALNSATLGPLSQSKYSRGFIHPVLSVERALYQRMPQDPATVET